MIARPQESKRAVSAVDHLLLGCSDLDRCVAWVEERTGLRAAPGGVHPGAGTRNALLSLAGGRYLELIAPDPAQSTFNFRTDIRQFDSPRLVNFAVRTGDIDAMAATAKGAGFEPLGPQPGSRRTPAGHMLRWRTLGVRNQLGAGGIEPVPFFIQWDADSPHPSASAPPGCELETLRFEHPDESRLKSALKSLGIDAEVTHAPAVRIIAMIKTPKGRVEIS